MRDLWAGKRVDFEITHLVVEGASLATPPDPIPLVDFGGSSAAARTVAARDTDVYLTWGEPLQQVAEKIRDVQVRARAVGRSIRFGIRLHVITRGRSKDAWAEARRLIANLDTERIAHTQAQLAEVSPKDNGGCGHSMGDRPPPSR